MRLLVQMQALDQFINRHISVYPCHIDAMNLCPLNPQVVEKLSIQAILTTRERGIKHGRPDAADEESINWRQALLDSIKWQIRAWESEERFPLLTRSATFGWLALGNFQDWAKIGRIHQSLSSNTFPTNVDDAVHEVCEGEIGAGIRPMQVQAELAALIHLVAERKPRTILEIGTARGGTLLLLSRFAAPDATVVSVDLPYGRNGGGYPAWKEKYYREFALPKQALHLLRADSHSRTTVERVREIIGGPNIDFVLIDGDHSYHGVKQDYQTYGSLVRPGGLLALHDILPNDQDPSIDVSRFWQELRLQSTHRTDEIVADPGQGAYGLGLVYL